MILPLAWLAAVTVAAVPSGPLTMLFYAQTFRRRWAAAAAVATVVMLADGVYAALAVFGYAWALERHPIVVGVVRALGVAVIAWLGVRLLVRPPIVRDRDGQDAGDGVRTALVQSLAVATFNPSALVTWVVVLDVLAGLTTPPTPMEHAALPFVVSLGAGSWFFALLAGWRTWLDPPLGAARVAIRGVGVALIGTAVAYAWRVLGW